MAGGLEQLELGQLRESPSSPSSSPLSSCSRQAWSRDNPGFEAEAEEDGAKAAGKGPVLQMEPSQLPQESGEAAESPLPSPPPPPSPPPRRLAWAKGWARRLRGEYCPVCLFLPPSLALSEAFGLHFPEFLALRQPRWGFWELEAERI
nr:PREDICTED: polycystin-2-like [Anolis carolinensis]|eukprot:XP_016849659.1 PREDICTED: polycystin-2-like [Anolis carolinensis]